MAPAISIVAAAAAARSAWSDVRHKHNRNQGGIMVDIIHRVGIRTPVSDVYRALSTIEGIAGWWTKETTGHSEPGGHIDVRFSTTSGERKGGMQMEVMALEPDSRVHWRFRRGPAEWIGTDAIFELSQDGDFTIVRFGHRNWQEPLEFT